MKKKLKPVHKEIHSDIMNKAYDAIHIKDFVLDSPNNKVVSCVMNGVFNPVWRQIDDQTDRIAIKCGIRLTSSSKYDFRPRRYAQWYK